MTALAAFAEITSTHVRCSIRREFAASNPLSFTARYDPYTQGIELLDRKGQIIKNMRQVNRELKTLMDALHKL